MTCSSNRRRYRRKEKLLFEELDVEWVSASQLVLPHQQIHIALHQTSLCSRNYFLNEVKQLPADLENYVLKPLFSFAGQGVVIDVTKEDIEKVKDPENWILQRKVKYADVIETPDIPAKAEIRIFYFWKDGEARPVAYQ